MKEILIVANWKENLTVPQAKKWLEEFSIFKSQFSNDSEVIICPSFVLIPVLHSQFSILNFPLRLGAQDVSNFEEGQYTGEVSAKMLADFVSYVIVGHSERREHFGETDEDIKLKIEQCLKYNLTPIVCVSKINQVSTLKQTLRVATGQGVSRMIFAYEPLFAVGTGTPDTPENANYFARKVKTEVSRDARVIYGGSVTSENVKSFVSQPDISGVLVGQASLDANEFAKVVKGLTR